MRELCKHLEHIEPIGLSLREGSWQLPYSPHDVYADLRPFLCLMKGIQKRVHSNARHEGHRSTKEVMRYRCLRKYVDDCIRLSVFIVIAHYQIHRLCLPCVFERVLLGVGRRAVWSSLCPQHRGNLALFRGAKEIAFQYLGMFGSLHWIGVGKTSIRLTILIGTNLHTSSYFSFHLFSSGKCCANKS